jgi:transcriptional regulator with XRE-family HTH domain
MGEKFGRLLRKYRKERGLTQWELYQELGDYGYLGEGGGSIISKWETGKRVPPYKTTVGLERILHPPGGVLVSAAGYSSTEPGNSVALMEKQRPELEGKAFQLAVERHQEGLLQLVKSWADELEAPVHQFTMTDLGGPGVHRNEHSLTWQNSPDGIRRRLAISMDTSVQNSLLWECLRQHLKGGDYSWLLEKLDEWERAGGQELQRRAELLKQVDDMLKERLTSVPAEPTPFFASTLVAALVDGVTPEYSFVGEPWAPQYTTYCGDSQIGSAAAREPADAFRVYHRALMAELDGHPLTEDVRGLRAKRDEIAAAIQKGLCELLVQAHIPGSCERCLPQA